MEIFYTVVSLLGGLSMFLYGMRLMGDGLKEGSSGTLKIVMEKVTNNPIKAFLLGLVVTAIIQSSTACIVITSGLVAAGILKFEQSLGIIIGANVGTTVTGQIIRLLDLNADAGSPLRLFQPSTLAPLALILGIVLVMFVKAKKTETVGNIAIGFGILFIGLLNMTQSVSGLKDILGTLFTTLGNNPVLGYLSGAGVAFVLQSSSATIGILQSFALTCDLPFSTVYIIIVGIYLGDCVTTAIVCSIGAKTDARRVGLVNILFNLSETVLVLVGVTLARQFGLLDSLWSKTLTSGGIANTNTVFNLTCAILLLPLVGVYAAISKKVIRDKPHTGKYADRINALNPVFFSTPALAFRSCYDVLKAMITASRENISRAFDQLLSYDEAVSQVIGDEEEEIDGLADAVSNYLIQLSPHVSEPNHLLILDQYYKLITEFERLGDYAKNISDTADAMAAEHISLSPGAQRELTVLRELLEHILDYADQSFSRRDVAAARHIEPNEEVMDDLTNAIHDNHLERLRKSECSMDASTHFLDILSNLERISDTCSNVGVAIVARVNPEVASKAHLYISSLHQGNDEAFNTEYNAVHEEFFGKLVTTEVTL